MHPRSLRLLFLCALAAPALAQEGPLSYLDFKPDPLLWGAEASAAAGLELIPGLDTGLWLQAGLAWLQADYFRTPDGGLFRSALGIDPLRTGYEMLYLPWGLGLKQGLYRFPGAERDALNLLLAWRAQWRWHWLDRNPGSLLAASPDPGRDWLLLNRLHLSLSFDTVSTQALSKVRSGLDADLGLDYSPPAWSTPSETHYLQATLRARGFLPLLETVSEEGFNLFSLYLAGQFSVDGIAGLGNGPRSGIPYPSSSRFGGLHPQSGLGGALRGLGDGWGDGTFKVVANLELRANLPAFLMQDLYVGALVFFDAGAYANPPGMPAGSPDQSAVLCSTGLGIFLNIPYLGVVTLYSDLLVNQENEKGQRWVPLSLDFGMHF